MAPVLCGELPVATIRIIKKYPNRRLYDTKLSRYVTLSDMRELVMQREEFRVIDSADNEDITRAILLQIMLEEESGGKPLFSAKMLSQLIRFYGGSWQSMFTRYMEESLDLFARQQQRMSEAMGGEPLEAMTRMAQRNMEMWSEMQESFFGVGGLGGKESEKSKKEK
jgi:polyhydroxyalkanoate synthesis repressor PhaR